MRILILSVLAAVTTLGWLTPTFAEESDHHAVIPFQVQTQELNQQGTNSALEGRIILAWAEGGGSTDVVGLWSMDEGSSMCWNPGNSREVAGRKSYAAFSGWDYPDPLILLFYAGDADFSTLDKRASHLLFCWPYPPCWDMYEDQFCIDGEMVSVMGWMPPGATLTIPDESELMFAATVD
jgi:hypothetical protein